MNDAKRKSANWGKVLRQLLVVTLIAWAVATELRKPAAERTWHGKLAERVPYDLRRPQLGSRARADVEPGRPAHPGPHRLRGRLDNQLRATAHALEGGARPPGRVELISLGPCG